MRIKRYMLVPLLCIIGLCACQHQMEKESQTYTFADTYVLMSGNGYSSFTTWNKYNILSGTLTTVCPDPVCTHASDGACPFVNVLCSCINGNDVYFVQKLNWCVDNVTQKSYLPEVINRYNFVTGNVQQLCTILIVSEDVLTPEKI